MLLIEPSGLKWLIARTRNQLRTMISSSCTLSSGCETEIASTWATLLQNQDQYPFTHWKHNYNRNNNVSISHDRNLPEIFIERCERAQYYRRAEPTMKVSLSSEGQNRCIHWRDRERVRTERYSTFPHRRFELNFVCFGKFSQLKYWPGMQRNTRANRAE